MFRSNLQVGKNIQGKRAKRFKTAKRIKQNGMFIKTQDGVEQK